MSKNNERSRLSTQTSHVVIQNGNESIDHIGTHPEAYDHIRRQLLNTVSLIQIFETQCRTDERHAEKERDVLLTVEEAADFIKVSKPTIYEFINSGELPYLEYGQRKQKRIWKSDLVNLGATNKSCGTEN